MKTLKKLVTVSFILGLSVLAVACGKQSATEDQKALPTTVGAKKSDPDDKGGKIRVAYGAGLCHAPIHIALENGYFKDEGLDVEASQMDSAVIAEAAGSGHLNASYGLVGKLIPSIENGLAIKLTAGIHTGCIQVVTRKDSDIKTLRDLKKKKIGVASLTDSPAVIAKRGLAAQKIGVSAANMEVEFVVYAAADLPAALNKGAIDAYAAIDPAVSVAVKAYDYRVLLDTSKDAPFKDEYCCATFVTSDFADKHPILAEKYTKAIMTASAWIEKNPEAAAKIQVDKGYVSGDAVFNGELLKSFNFIPSVKGGDDALSDNVAALKAIDLLQPTTDKKTILKNNYLTFKALLDFDAAKVEAQPTPTGLKSDKPATDEGKEKDDCCE